MISGELRDWAIILLVLSFLYGLINGLVATAIVFVLTVVMFQLTKKELEEQRIKKFAELAKTMETLFPTKKGGKA